MHRELPGEDARLREGWRERKKRSKGDGAVGFDRTPCLLRCLRAAESADHTKSVAGYKETSSDPRRSEIPAAHNVPFPAAVRRRRGGSCRSSKLDRPFLAMNAVLGRTLSRKFSQLLPFHFLLFFFLSEKKKGWGSEGEKLSHEKAKPDGARKTNKSKGRRGHFFSAFFRPSRRSSNKGTASRLPSGVLAREESFVWPPSKHPLLCRPLGPRTTSQGREGVGLALLHCRRSPCRICRAGKRCAGLPALA